MAKITVQPDCGNAPRKLFLKDFNSALANGDIDFITANISEKINWEIIGQSSVTGKEDYLKALPRHQLWEVKELVINTIITHGPDASVSGEITTADKSKFAFCDVYKFKGAGGTTLNSIRTFIVKL